MGLRRVLAILGGLLVAGSATALVVDVAVSNEGPPRYGFAVWPADTAAEADEECSFLDRFTWRGSAEKTSERFAREMELAGYPPIETVIEGDTARVLLPGTGTDNEQSLSLRRESGCWYVRHVGQGDGSSAVSTGYAGVGSKRRVFLHLPFDVFPWEGTFGIGSLERRFEPLPPHPEGGGLMLTLPATEDESGHYFLGTRETDPPNLDFVHGEVIAPAFDPADLPVVPSPERSREILFDSVQSPRDCRGWYWQEYSETHAIRQTLPVATHYSSEAPRYELRKTRRGYVATLLDDLDVTFEFWRPVKGCHVLGRISSSERASRVSQVRAGTDSCSFSFGWGRADEAYVMCGFGETDLDGTVGKIGGPIQLRIGGIPGIDPSSVRDEPGRYLVAFYDDGEMIDLEGGALPPFEDLP